MIPTRLRLCRKTIMRPSHNVVHTSGADVMWKLEESQGAGQRRGGIDKKEERQGRREVEKSEVGKGQGRWWKKQWRFRAAVDKTGKSQWRERQGSKGAGRQGRGEGEGFQAIGTEDIKSLLLLLPLSRSRSLCSGCTKGGSKQLLPPS